MLSDLEQVEAALAAFPEPHRTALMELRATIRTAAPGAEEYIGYSVPAFRLDGPLVSYGAGNAHCAFYVQSPKVMETFAADLTGLDTSKGTIRFKPEAPLPGALVAKIVKARIAENAATMAARKAKRAGGPI